MPALWQISVPIAWSKASLQVAKRIRSSPECLVKNDAPNSKIFWLSVEEEKKSVQDPKDHFFGQLISPVVYLSDRIDRKCHEN